MFKRLLVPVDGSPLTERAMEVSIALAKQLGATITGFVAEPLPPARPGLIPTPCSKTNRVTTTN